MLQLLPGNLPLFFFFFFFQDHSASSTPSALPLKMARDMRSEPDLTGCLDTKCSPWNDLHGDWVLNIKSQSITVVTTLVSILISLCNYLLKTTGHLCPHIFSYNQGLSYGNVFFSPWAVPTVTMILYAGTSLETTRIARCKKKMH